MVFFQRNLGFLRRREKRSQANTEMVRSKEGFSGSGIDSVFFAHPETETKLLKCSWQGYLRVI